MKKLPLLLIAASVMQMTSLITAAKTSRKSPSRQDYKIYVDKNGVMRRSDTKKEVSYFGTNYTAPFAYSYRALGYLDKDRKQAIDRDIYHIARMGQNAFRLHLWDAEIADSAGNLISNEHLELLDYMISMLEERGIDIILTAQTNFGNGYPERNIDTGAFTYDFDKCQIHDDPAAQAIQENYLKALVRHVNPYTGRSYASDNAIIAMEINNEPCHSGSKKEVTAYINRMANALRHAGFDKPILYNVTHNPQVTSAYYDAEIDGTTFQWYPTGLVSGYTRKGNLLPAFDNYTIPWKDTMQNYGRLARVVYEFDPADVMYSHLYPAVARAFRKEGFQWITQFAYDPIDLAPFNTEYPTHYLNLAYTPAKAISMMIAAEAAREIPRGADFGSYPQNTSFGNTTISYERDLSEFNSPEKFIYSNTTASLPKDPDKLKQVAGHGSSPVVNYSGTGAYFLDKISGCDAWRLELMPDVVQIDDPFCNTSLKDAKTVTVNKEQSITINLKTLGQKLSYQRIKPEHGSIGHTDSGEFKVTPGVYLIAKSDAQLAEAYGASIAGIKVAGNIGIDEYVAPDNDRLPITLLAPTDFDKDMDIAMIPEEWSFKFNKKPTNWDEEPVFILESNPQQAGKIVIRRYVADKIGRIPESINPQTICIKFQKESGDTKANALPDGTELAVVTDKGFTYSVPVILNSDGEFSTEIAKLSPRGGLIMPAPYPVTVTRESPKSDKPINGFSEIQFVEIIIPQQANVKQTLLPERIWIE